MRKLSRPARTPSILHRLAQASRPVVGSVTIAALLVGCHAAPKKDQDTLTSTPPGLLAPVENTDLHATVSPPINWTAEPLKATPKHKHQVWLSPSKNTAYGVIYFTLPWPVGTSLALFGFLDQMKKSEGQANLLSQQDDDHLPGVRFVAEGGLYTIRTNFIVNGYQGWAIYAGTIRKQPVNDEELKQAENAREHTRVDEK